VTANGNCPELIVIDAERSDDEATERWVLTTLSLQYYQLTAIRAQSPSHTKIAQSSFQISGMHSRGRMSVLMQATPYQ
jgi:hypothetical protein